MILVRPNSTFPLSPGVLHDNVLSRAVLTGTTPLAGTNVMNVLGPQTYDFWGPNAGAGILTGVLPVAETCDCFCMAAHNFGTFQKSISVQYAVDDVAAFVSLSGTVAITDDNAVMITFPPTLGKRWRLSISDPLVTGVGAFVGIVSIGARLVFPGEVRPSYVPANHARRVEAYPSLSMEGQYLANRIKRRGGEMSVAFSPLARTWVDGSMTAFQRHYDDGKPFFWASAPEKYVDDISYCWRPEGASELRPAYSEGGRYAAVNMELATYGA